MFKKILCSETITAKVNFNPRWEWCRRGPGQPGEAGVGSGARNKHTDYSRVYGMSQCFPYALSVTLRCFYGNLGEVRSGLSMRPPGCQSLWGLQLTSTGEQRTITLTTTAKSVTGKHEQKRLLFWKTDIPGQWNTSEKWKVNELERMYHHRSVIYINVKPKKHDAKGHIQ